MKSLKKSALSLAMSSAIVGGLMAAQPAFALLQSAASTGAPYVSVNGTGQALVFPYYTVRGGFKSFFNVTNTSDRTVAYKVRLREGLNSRDALDFTLVLSPFDVWTGWVEDTATGPVLRSPDNSCTVGADDAHDEATGGAGAGQPLSNLGYNYQPAGINNANAFTDQGDGSIDRTREGYVEFIPMGVATSETNNPLAAAALHATATTAKTTKGVPFACGDKNSPVNNNTINGMFKAADGQLTLPVPFPFPDAGADGDGDPLAANWLEAMENGFNPLKGNFSIIQEDSGIGAGNTAVHIADFMNDVALTTAQNFPYFLEPTLASGNGIWTVTGLAGVDTALATNIVANEWAENSGTGAGVDWTINFPTKSFYVDDEDKKGVVTSQNIQASVNQWRVGSAALGAARTGAGFTGTFGDLTADGSKVEVMLANWDREEQFKETDTGAAQPSPAPIEPEQSIYLYREANVLTYKAEGTNLESEAFLASPAAADLSAPNGWTMVGFSDGDDGLVTFPAVGFAFKVRNQGNAGISYGQIMDHAYAPAEVEMTPVAVEE